MIEIMDTLQKYVPVHSEEMTVDVPGIGEKKVYGDWFHHVLFGGDMLTAKRAEAANISGAILPGDWINWRGYYQLLKTGTPKSAFWG